LKARTVSVPVAHFPAPNFSVLAIVYYI